MKKKIVVLIVILLLSIGVEADARKKTIDRRTAEYEKQLENATGEKKVDVLNSLSTLYVYEEPTRAVEYGNQAVNLSEEINYQPGKASAFIRLAHAYWNLGDKKKPFELSHSALEIFKKSGDNSGTWFSLHAIAHFYQDDRHFEKALKYNIESLKVCEEVKDKDRIAESLYTIGNIYLCLGDYEKALKSYQRALKIGKEAGIKQRVVYYINSIGIAYMELNRYDLALENFQKALTLFTERGDSYGISNTLLNIGIIYQKSDRYDLSLKYLRNGLDKFEQSGSKGGRCRTLLQIGNNYFKMNHYKKAIAYYDEALKLAREINDQLMIENIYEKFSEVYAAAGDYKKSLTFYKRFTKIKDRLINEKKNKQIAELQEQYEAEKREKEIEILKKTNKLQQFTRNVFIAGFFLVLILLVFIFKKYMYLFTFWKKQKYIGQYRLLESIGSGGMGNVFKAHNIRAKSSIAAVKILKEELFKVEGNRKRFIQEGAIIDKLDHPNILKIYERGVYEEKLYFAMEFIKGITLEKKIEQEGRIDLSECLFIMSQVTDALALIHSQDIVHRDLKPANIMLTEKNGNPNFVKLLDFGLSKIRFQAGVTESGFLVGTINYIAPEQIADFKYSPASDIYSLGIIFYEMVIGQTVFPGDSLASVVEHILDDTPAVPKNIRPGIPGELNRLILQMISKQDTLRPSAQRVLDTLKEISLSYPPGI
jgi:tetratricopeptide (TPR) repeat protein